MALRYSTVNASRVRIKNYNKSYNMGSRPTRIRFLEQDRPDHHQYVKSVEKALNRQRIVFTHERTDGAGRVVLVDVDYE